jgi:hypothetical protein
MKPVLCSFLLLLSLIQAQEGQLVPTELFTGAIFSGEDYNSPEELKNLSYIIGKEVIGTWTPKNEDVLTLESTFITTLQTMSRQEAPVILERLSDYKRQYIGVKLLDQHLIFATFDSCTDMSHEELTQRLMPLLYEDGGICFIEVLFDLKAKTIYHLYIHGEA